MYLITGACVVNEGQAVDASVWIKDDRIAGVFQGTVPEDLPSQCTVIDGSGCWLLPGVIDDHVHFRDPGFPQKADFYTESCAAVAGGVTSVLDMPNTKPQTTSMEALYQKAAEVGPKSVVNYGFYLGVTDANQDELNTADYSKVCGVKLFVGSSTGNMLVTGSERLRRLFNETPALIAVHAEDEATIQANLAHYQKLCGAELPLSFHSRIRSASACYKASSMLVQMAKETGARLHLMHISTAAELGLLDNKPLAEKRITAECCPHYLYFSEDDYERLGARVKCNPAIKSSADREGLLRGLNTQKIDVIGTDHAPHALADKQGGIAAASGMPGVQFALPLMLNLVKQGYLTIDALVDKMCHNPARLFAIKDRGFVREGCYADLVLVQRNANWVLDASMVLSKCGWSPYEQKEFTTRVMYTFVNGQLAYTPNGVCTTQRGRALEFVR